MYPVTYEADYQRERNRGTTFFRLIVAIPWLIVSLVYGIGQLVAAILAWFALLFTGRYPAGLYRFVGRVLQFNARVDAFLYLQTDAWPPFSIGPDPEYPARVEVMPRAAHQSRAKAFFRLILALPLLILAHAVSMLQSGVTLISWLTIVFRGYQPAAMHNAIAWMIGWTIRVNAYCLLMRDEYPPVGDEVPVLTAPPAPDEIEAAAHEEPPPLHP